MRASKQWMAALALLGAAVAAQAVTVSNNLVHLDTNTWQANFLVTNNDFAPNLASITVYFQQDAFNLLIPGSPVGWDVQAFEPDSSPSPGFADALASSGFELLPTSQTLQFSARFDWTQAVAPSPVLLFTVNDPSNFAVLSQGNTFAATVPEPSTWALMAAGSLMLLGAARRRRPI